MLCGLLFAPGLASAQADPSSHYLWMCQQENPVLCLGLILGLEEGVKAGASKSALLFGYNKAEYQEHYRKVSRAVFGCISEDATYKQMYDIWVQHLEDTPDLMAAPFRDSFAKAMLNAFPCP